MRATGAAAVEFVGNEAPHRIAWIGMARTGTATAKYLYTTPLHSHCTATAQPLRSHCTATAEVLYAATAQSE